MDEIRHRQYQLEVRDFRLMDALGQRKSLTSAAELLNLSQSALSHQLRRLEERLEVQLFERVGKQMKPTIEGLRLIQSSRDMLDQIRQVQLDVTESARKERVRIRISASCSTYYSWLARVLGEFSSSHRNIDIEITHKSRVEELAALLSGDVDIIVSSHRPNPKNYEVEALFEINVIALMSNHHALAAKASKQGGLEWRDLSNEMLMIHDLPDSDEREFHMAVLGANAQNNSLSKTVNLQRINLTEAIVELARSNQGIGIIGEWVDDPPCDLTGLLTIMPNPVQRRQLWCVWKKNHSKHSNLVNLSRYIRRSGHKNIS